MYVYPRACWFSRKDVFLTNGMWYICYSCACWFSRNTIVATYPSVGGRRGAHECVFQGRKMHGVATNVYLRKTSEKPERCGLRTLIVKGLGVVFTHGKCISTPRVRHKGRKPLIKCANMTSKCFIFPFFMSFCVFMLFMFFCIFLPFRGQQGCFPRSYVSSIAMRKSNLRSSLRTEHWLSCFYLFLQDIFWPNKSHLRHWTIKRSFDFWKGEKR